MTRILQVNDGERLAYRRAVQSALEKFYGQGEDTAKQLVREWWIRLTGTKAYKSGLFLHDEVLQTAADLLHTQRRRLSASEQDLYRQILDESWNLENPASVAESIQDAVAANPGLPIHMVTTLPGLSSLRNSAQPKGTRRQSNSARAARKHLAAAG